MIISYVLKHFKIQRAGSLRHCLLSIQGPWEAGKQEGNLEAGCEIDIIEYICMLGPYPSFPKRQSLRQMLTCCCFTGECNPRGAGERARRARQEGGRTCRAMILI